MGFNHFRIKILSNWFINCSLRWLFCFRFVPDREFAGTDRSRRREGPVQFEQADEEDPFNLTEFLKTAKRGEKRAGEDSRRDYESSKSKKRRD